MLCLTRKAEFAASHYYHNPDLSPDENRRICGKCNNPNGHGHNYFLEVTVKGEIDPPLRKRVKAAAPRILWVVNT
jgi:6-pyruvoyltetrahydropterin/6-carboxytetrahydropterin synthase